jgi:16S rRNA (guanine966-N2)-methyltransferase
VIAGEAGGRRLVSPPGDRVRPTTDRVKESVFSALGPDRLAGARILDLYAGTGALALEALSRGGSRALLVERDVEAGRAIVANLERTGMADRGALRRGDVRAVLSRPGPEEFDLIFMDPPYDLPDDELESVIGLVAAPGWAAPAATLVIERAGGGHLPSLPPGWRSTWERCYGDTLVLFAQRE